MGYPPVAALVNLIVRAEDEGKGRDAAAALGRRAARSGARRGYRVLGPARAPLARLRQEHRFQILLKGQAQGDARRRARGARGAATARRAGPESPSTSTRSA